MLTSHRGGVSPPLRRIGEVEIARSRRLGTPLSLLVLAREQGSEDGGRSHRRLSSRWRRSWRDLERLSTAVEPHVRAYDSVILDPDGRRVTIVAPEATAMNADRMRERLEALLDGFGPVRVGVVTFPDHGAFIHGLVARADADRRNVRVATPTGAEGGRR